MFGLPADRDRSWGVFPALVLCRENDFPLTKAGLVYIARKYNLGLKVNGHWRINQEALLEYIRTSTELPPRGWLTVSAASSTYKVSKYMVYKWIRYGWIEHGYYGHGKGILYVKGSDVKQGIESYTEKHNEEKGS